jgi:hypothetical protein
MKYTIELKSYSLDQIRDLEEEFEYFLYKECIEDSYKSLLYEYRLMKAAFFQQVVTDVEYANWLCGVIGGEDEYWDDEELSATEIAEEILQKVINHFEEEFKRQEINLN